MKAPRGQLEQRLLVLLTLALVAFGLVMVFSATSAAAALGKGDPITFLERQGVYALIGVALLVAASRFDHRRLRNIAPPLLLTAREYALLEYLMRYPEQILSRNALLENVWGYDFETPSNVLEVYMNFLRKKIDAKFPRKLLHTVRGAGYVLKEEEG